MLGPVNQVLAGGQTSQPGLRSSAVVVQVIRAIVSIYAGLPAQVVAPVWPIAVAKHDALINGVQPVLGCGTPIAVLGSVDGRD